MNKHTHNSIYIFFSADFLQHLVESRHICVYHKGRFYRLCLYDDRTLLSPRQLQTQIQRILDDPSPPQPGEDKLAALTAGDRWDQGKGEKTRKTLRHGQNMDIYYKYNLSLSACLPLSFLALYTYHLLKLFLFWFQMT